ncbi:MAG: hydroxymethylbilane synthase [Flavobacteriales bacterium]|nr:hydroxymethylbilane synthase [Flavobacteriales bacterium]|tara:strand:+ start:3342 stop:4256 length:915 start_codon:yes stop_codon:yes gene_type:complete
MHIKIGSRKSKLALWQTHHIADKLTAIGHTFEIILIDSEGDKVLDTPLPMIGGKGVFTKALDDAILNKKIDIAVHSFKDIPTVLESNLEVCAILKRENPTDALVCRKDINFLKNNSAVVATSSNRRKAQWLNKYPHHKMVDIRGNVPTRIQKLKDSQWDATILASAGLIRLGLENEIGQELTWMVSAPAQGAIAIICHTENKSIKSIVNELNDEDTALCTRIERSFLNILNGGCSAPVGAHVILSKNKLSFYGVVVSTDGKEKILISLEDDKANGLNLAKKAAQEALDKGAKKLIESAENEKYS